MHAGAPPGTRTGAYTQAQFHLIPDAGHAFDEPSILARLIQATDTYAANPA